MQLFIPMSKYFNEGVFMGTKQPLVVKLPPHMVKSLYCERYLSFQTIVGKIYDKPNLYILLPLLTTFVHAQALRRRASQVGFWQHSGWRQTSQLGTHQRNDDDGLVANPEDPEDDPEDPEVPDNPEDDPEDDPEDNTEDDPEDNTEDDPEEEPEEDPEDDSVEKVAETGDLKPPAMTSVLPMTAHPG